MSAAGSKAVALVTGGTSGIGLATARLLHEQGWSVLVTGANPQTIEAATGALPRDVIVMKADARSLDDADRVAEEMKARFGRIDFAFLNAGVGRMRPIEAVDEAEFDDHFDTNVKGRFFMLQKLLPLFDRGGSVVFTTAVGAHRGAPAWSVYSAAKAAMGGLAPALAVELAPRGIRVNAIRPGPTQTPAFSKLALPPEAETVFRQGVPKRLPIGRLASAEEIAEAVVFLASARASFITGTTLDVDGGMSSVASVINLN